MGINVSGVRERRGGEGGCVNVHCSAVISYFISMYMYSIDSWCKVVELIEVMCRMYIAVATAILWCQM